MDPALPQEMLSDEENARFQKLVLARTGLVFTERRRKTLDRALLEGASHAGYNSLDLYFSALQGSETGGSLWEELIKALTVCETYFFRDPDQIEALRCNILPDLIARHWSDRTLRLWSAGCSSGEEPYTLAILLRQLLPDIDHWRILILATDINRHALHKAALGHYRSWSFRETGESLRATYFDHHGEHYELIPPVRQMVTFAYLNLAEEIYPSHATDTTDLDLILCRNVTIYLPETVISAIAHRFHRCLSTGGWLIVGPSETNDTIYKNFQVLKFGGAIVYQKIIAASPEPAAPLQDLPAFPARPAVTGGKPLEKPPLFSPTLLQKPVPPAVLPPPSRPALTRGKEDVVELYRRGEKLISQHCPDEASQCFTACLQQIPGHVPSLFRLARLSADSGRLDEARSWAEQVLSHDPLHSESHYILAQVSQEQGDETQAMVCYKKVLYLSPGFVLAHYNLSGLYQKAGRPAEAARHRAHAVRLASALSPDTILFGSDEMTAADLLKMIGAQ
jgi:chemotaxis protein methyltransferase CheR